MGVLPSTPFTSIDNARVAVDAPGSTDLMTDLSVNDNYLLAQIGMLGKNTVVFTAIGLSTWTVPPGVTKIIVEMLGAGGGGGGGGSTIPATPYYAGCGGFGAWVKAAFTVTPGSVISVNVGAKGAGGIGGNPVGANGGDGGNSWVIVAGNNAAGGKGGRGFTGGANALGGAGGIGVPSATSFAVTGSTGATGGAGATTTPGPWEWGRSGSCPNAVPGAAGTASTIYGSGGGGGQCGQAPTFTGGKGGNGADGFILISY